MLNYDKAPTVFLGQQFKSYIEDKVPLGSFLTAVFENKLIRSFELADDTNRNLMFEIAYWIYNEAPFNCWGSKEIVEEWLKNE